MPYSPTTATEKIIKFLLFIPLFPTFYAIHQAKKENDRELENILVTYGQMMRRLSPENESAVRYEYLRAKEDIKNLIEKGGK